VREAEEVHKGEKVVKKPRTEVIEALYKIEEAVKHKDKNRKVIITQGGNVVAIKNQAGTAEDEAATEDVIAKAKNVTRERAVRYANYRRAVLRGSKNLVDQGGSVADVYTWTVPALKQAKLISKVNMSLRAENKALKKKIAVLKTQPGQLAH